MIHVQYVIKYLEEGFCLKWNISWLRAVEATTLLEVHVTKVSQVFPSRNGDNAENDKTIHDNRT